MNTLTVFRCDGDGRVGAGHVSRCVALARAFRLAGYEVLLVGRYGDLAGALVAASGLPTAAPSRSPAGIPPEADLAVIDSYEIERGELAQLHRKIPVGAIFDGQLAPPVAVALSYRVDADRLQVPGDTVGIVGPDYAPVDPRLIMARRERGFARVLVTMGASTTGREELLSAVRALVDLGTPDIFVAGAFEITTDLAEHVSVGTEPGLSDRIRWADAAIGGAGTTAYDFACAGLPAALRVIAEHQEPFARGLEQAGAAVLIRHQAQMAQTILSMRDGELRARLAVAGPALIDGYGAFRARDAILDAFAGVPQRAALRYRPATPRDSGSVLRWRNEPETRAASRDTEPIPPQVHRQWFAARIERTDEPLLIIEHRGASVGSIRFDRRDREAEISVTLDPVHRGRGLGSRAIREASELLLAADDQLQAVIASVRRTNAASARAFERAGFHLDNAQNGWMWMRLKRESLRWAR